MARIGDVASGDCMTRRWSEGGSAPCMGGTIPSCQRYKNARLDRARRRNGGGQAVRGCLACPFAASERLQSRDMGYLYLPSR